jgi:enterochelin esterase-like enzyme
MPSKSQLSDQAMHYPLLCQLFLTPGLLLSLMACSTFTPKALDYERFQLSDPNKTMDYGVYTPPGWSPEERLPLVLFLHGSGDNHTSFEKFGAHKYCDQQISANNMPRFILLTPNGKKGFWENWYDGTQHYRDWVLNEVLPKVQKDYNSLPCPENCHLAGISMGGFGALRFAWFAKEKFSSISAISAPILSMEENRQAKNSLFIRFLYPLARIFGPNFAENYADNNIEKVWLNDKDLQKLKLQLIWGDHDTEMILKGNERFHNLLTTNNIKHDHYVYSGGHKWRYWIPQLNRVINFLINEPERLTPPITNPVSPE